MITIHSDIYPLSKLPLARVRAAFASCLLAPCRVAFYVLAASLLLGSWLGSPALVFAQATQSVDRVVAVVNNEAIT
jgi:hypothetical protein